MGAEKLFYARHQTGDSLLVTPPLDEFSGWAKHQFFKGGRYRLVDQTLKDKKVEHLVELGCGGGESTVWMNRYAQECTGCDIRLPSHLKSLKDDRFHFLEFNFNNNFPIKSESIDVVVAMMIMEHVFDPFHFCSEAQRILRPKGFLYLNVPLVTGIKNRIRLLFGELPMTSSPDWYSRREWDGGHLHYFSIPLLKRLLSESGFRILEWHCPGRMNSIKGYFPGLLANEISLFCVKIA